MIEVAGNRVSLSGRVTMAEAAAVLEEGRRCISGDQVVFDLGQISEADSSALAVLFGWLREAKERGVNITLANTPRSLVSLADVYGVADFLPHSA